VYCAIETQGYPATDLLHGKPSENLHRSIRHRFSFLLFMPKQVARRFEQRLIQESLWKPNRGHDQNITSHKVKQLAISRVHMNAAPKKQSIDILEFRWSTVRDLLLGEIGDIFVDGGE
jgi:hypothetical protein